jgi:L,D-peptidoglycan transpeptidase YkuD (ErfK/YbiS/YcfS/YnhG family)
MPAHRRPHAVRPRRLRLSVVALLAVVTVPLLVTGPSSPASAYPSGTDQLITVRTSSPTATVGLLRAYDRVNGAWKLRIGPTTVRVGAAGIGAASEGSTRTPAGDWALPQAFGRKADPGTKMRYFRTDRYDWWNGNTTSKNYNKHVRAVSSPGGASENLYLAGSVYDYAVVMGYNPDGIPGAGSAFFLHVSNGKPTAGCAAVSRTTMVQLLRWLDPAKNPHIRVGVY